MKPTLKPYIFIFALILGVIIRIALLGSPGLIDTTDARYASIGLAMVTSDNWVTPYVNQGAAVMPYWSKPALGFWMTAGSYLTFGISEWSARLPSCLSTLLALVLTMMLAERWWGKCEALLAGVIFLSSVLIFFMAGACTMDAALGAALTGGMVSFALVARAPTRGAQRFWGVTFFLALAMGTLAKGPIALVFPALGIFFWLLATKQWAVLLRFPWIVGGLIFLAVALPWYYFAEKATPGFLRYFLLSENFQRFASDDLKIKYGVGHRSPLGAVWLMLVGAVFPWSLMLLAALYQNIKRLSLRANSEFLFALSWGLVPVFFLSFGRQVVATYLEPMLPGLALASAYLIVRAPKYGLECWLRNQFRVLALVLSIVSLVVVVYGLGHGMAGWFLFFGLLLFVLTFMASLRAFKEVSDLTAATGWITVALFGFYGAIVAGLSTEVTLRRSTLPALAGIKQEVGDAPTTIAFLGEVPESAQVYRSLIEGSTFRVVGIPVSKVGAVGIRYLVVRQGDVATLPVLSATKSVDFGRWRVFELNN